MQNSNLYYKDLKVLVIEDDDINSMLLQSLLETEGMVVSVTSTGEEGLEQLKTCQFDIALIDINLGMSSYDGTDVIRQFKQICPNAKTITIALTAYAMVGDKEKFLASGFDAYHPKPIFIEDLLKLIQQLKERPLSENKQPK